MQKYELMIVIQGQIPEDLAKEISQKVRKNIEEQGADHLKEDFWGRRKLSYRIEDQDHAYYDVFDFMIAPDKVSKLEDELKLTNEVIRFLLTRKEDKTEIVKKKDKVKKQEEPVKVKKQEKEESKPIKAKETDKEVMPAKKTEKKIEKKKEPLYDKKDTEERLEELDKKIDEILKD